MPGQEDAFRIHAPDGNTPVDGCVISLGDIIVNFRGLNAAKTKIEQQIAPRSRVGEEIIVLQTLDLPNLSDAAGSKAMLLRERD